MGLGRVAKAVGVPLLVVGALLVSASPAYAFVTPLSSATFTTDSEAANWTLPSVGSNGSCLTAGPSTALSSIPDCNPTIDSPGGGALRLTNNGGDLVGSVFYSVSLPTSQGLDVSFDTYQYNGSGADGITFGLAAANPADPAAPSSVGALGGALGYSTNGSTGGVPYGYLGLGLDVYGNYENSQYGGSSCTLPPGLSAGTAYPEAVTARGPGDGTAGYCILGTTASTYKHGNGGGSGGDTISNLGATEGAGGYYLDKQSATSRSGLAVPVEIVINPSSTAATGSTSGLAVPASSWFVAYEPLGASSWQSISGALPTTSNNTVLANDFPSSWIDPTTGIPYQLTFGWTASTGGANEIHEVTGLGAQSLNGPIPVLAVANGDNENGEFLAGNQTVYSLSPSVSSDGGAGGNESSELTLTDTFPTGIAPGTASAASDWSCVTAGQVVTCTYTPSAAIAAGTSLPDVTIPATIASGASGSLSAVARISSDDGDPGTATDSATVTKLTASASPSSTSYGNAVLVSVAGMPAGATGTVSFKSGGTTLCSTTLPTLSCDTSSTLGPASYPVTASYSGDGNYKGAVAATSFTITKSAAYSMSASASPISTPYGNAVSLSVSGLPGGATGTVSFKSGGTTLCSTTLPSLTCSTLSTLDAASYPVTATYSGDANYLGSSVGTSFTITKLPTSMSASATPSSTSYGDAVSLSTSGLPGGATGTVTFSSGAATLCTASLPSLSCEPPATTGAGIYDVTATYSGDTNYNGSSATTSFRLIRSAAYSMSASASPSSTPYGNAVSLSVSGIPGDATGTVSFKSGTTTLCTATLPTHSCSTSSTLGAADYSITALYAGDINYDGSSATTSFTITKATTSITASATPGSTSYGDTVSLSASGLPGGASGTVTFTSAGNTLCTAILPAQSCEPPATTGTGTYDVTASYSGDTNYDGSSATTSFTLTQSAAYSMTASASPASTSYGNAVSLSVSGIPGDATGTVTFTSGTTTLCTASLPTPTCVSSSSLAAASYSVTASYGGDANYAGASAGTSFTITKSATAMTASASPGSAPYENPIVLSAAGLPGDATGTIAFSSGAATLCTATLPAESCEPATTTGAGTYPVTAAYSGDGNYDGSTAQTSFVITKVSGYSMSAVATPSSTPHGNSVALLASGLPIDATGTVSFTSGAATLCSATVVHGAASCPTSSSLAAGSDAVTATYPGDDNHDGSTAATSFTITKATISISALASPSSTSYGETVSLSLSGLPSDATGTVSFTSGTSTLCTATLPAQSCEPPATLSGGTYPVVASYSGDANYDGSSAQTSFAVTTSSDYSMAASASPVSVLFGNGVTLSVSGLPSDATGTVSFEAGTARLCTSRLPAVSCVTSPTLDAGGYGVTATYSGDVDYAGSSAGTSFTITKSATSMTASASPASASYGHRVSLSVSGLPAGAAGSVTFSLDSATLCTASLPQRSCYTTSSLPAGSYPVTATYSGDPNYNGSSAKTSFAITATAGYVMSATANPGSTPSGNAVLLSVAGLPGDATGSVGFISGGATLCTARLPHLSCETSSSLGASKYEVTATYSGDANYGGSSAKTSFTITKNSGFTMTASTNDPTMYGRPVTVSVSAVPGDATGTVTFVAGTTTLCTAKLPKRSCDTSSSLAVGGYKVTAIYSGDSTYGRAFATTSFTITRSSDRNMTAFATPSLARFGESVMLSATGLGVDAGGPVTFWWHSRALCSSAVSGGRASCNVAKDLDVRRYVVAAEYGGDGHEAPASASTAFSVIQLASSMRAEAAPTIVAPGRVVVLSVVGLSSRAAGTVKFTAAGVLLCTAKLPSTSCSVASKLLGDHFTVTAVYSGSTNYSPATAKTAFVVRERVAGTNVTLYTTVGSTVSVRLPIPTGTGPFSLAIKSQGPLNAGVCSVTASGHFRFVPAPRFVGTVTCSYVVRSRNGLVSAPAVVTIFVTSAGSPIPSAHTGEPWAASSYWRLVGTLALSGLGLIILGVRRRRHLRHV